MAESYWQTDRKATVDFVSDGVSVELSIADGKLYVKASMSHGETASTWDQHEAEWPLPPKGDENG